MDCKKAQKELSAFVDEELPLNSIKEMSDHIEYCADCKKDYDDIVELNNMVRKELDIEPSREFRSKLKSKLPVKEKKGFRFPVLKWLPAPMTAAFVLLFFIGFLTFSPVVYSIGDDVTKQEFVQLAKDHFTCNTAQKLFSPAAFLAFCNKSCTIMCNHCSRNNEDYKCQMKGCHNEHGK